jgi:pyridoxal phosphate enzyme (YggS family)
MYNNIKHRIAAAALRSGRRAEDISLVAVSKGQPVAAMQELYDAGARVFGESRVQEALPKIAAFGEDTAFHFIGRLQSNKFKAMSGKFSLIHSLDNEKDAIALAKYGNWNVLLQVNPAGEAQKGGVAPSELGRLIDKVSEMANLKLRGLMFMPPWDENPEKNRGLFANVRELFENYRNYGIDTLSMGMSGDFEVAIEEGATMVRVGTALFGE